MLITYSWLRRRNLVAFPVREMVFARGKFKLVPDQPGLHIYIEKAPSVGRTVDLGMFLNYSAGACFQSPPEAVPCDKSVLVGRIIFEAWPRAVRPSYRKDSAQSLPQHRAAMSVAAQGC